MQNFPPKPMFPERKKISTSDSKIGRPPETFSIVLMFEILQYPVRIKSFKICYSKPNFSILCASGYGKFRTLPLLTSLPNLRFFIWYNWAWSYFLSAFEINEPIPKLKLSASSFSRKVMKKQRQKCKTSPWPRARYQGIYTWLCLLKAVIEGYLWTGQNI